VHRQDSILRLAYLSHLFGFNVEFKDLSAVLYIQNCQSFPLANQFAMTYNPVFAAEGQNYFFLLLLKTVNVNFTLALL